MAQSVYLCTNLLVRVPPNKLWYHIIFRYMYVDNGEDGQWIGSVVHFGIWYILKHHLTSFDQCHALSSVPVFLEWTSLLHRGVCRGGEGRGGSVEEPAGSIVSAGRLQHADLGETRQLLSSARASFGIGTVLHVASDIHQPVLAPTPPSLLAMEKGCSQKRQRA